MCFVQLYNFSKQLVKMEVTESQEYIITSWKHMTYYYFVKLLWQTC